MMTAMWVLLVCVLFVQILDMCCHEVSGKKDKLSKGDRKVDDIMHELQGTCLKNNPEMTLRELLKDTELILNDIGVYKEIVKANKKLRDEIKWIIGESKGPKEVLRIVQLLKRDMRKVCHTPSVVKSCSELKDKKSGVYNLTPDSGKGFKAYCNMEVAGGGWTVIQQRKDGSTDFQRTWLAYKNGFGNIKDEFWLGNENIHRLTSKGKYELRVDLADWKGNTWHAIYKTFVVGAESSKYKLSVGEYSGTAGDSLTYHNSSGFSTKDQDNDKNSSSCSKSYGFGGWWYKNCYHSSLNGQYGKGQGTKGVNWNHVKPSPLMKFTRMMIRLN